MFVLPCVRQTEEDLKKERKKQRAENEGAGGEGRPGRGTRGPTPTGTSVHASLPPLWFSGLAH